MFNFSGTRPKNIGAKDGRLTPCPEKPNCVCSQSGEEQKRESVHHVPPLTFEGDARAAMQRVVKIVKARPEAQIVQQTDNYLYAEFSTSLMGFVDDVEFLVVPAAGQIHVRSASRLGYSDWGVNRARIEEMREAFDDLA